MPQNLKTVLIVDHDLGFVFWLGRVLDRAGYIALPARTAADALTLIGRSGAEFNLLVINPALDGAPALIEALRRGSPRAGIITVSPVHSACAPSPPGSISIPKPAALNPILEFEWLGAVETLLDG